MRVSSSWIVAVASAFLCSLVVAQGPITTNNAISACVQFGDCTSGGPFATTETQQTPVTPPPSSQAIAPATNSVESQASISNLAATGAAAAYSSRVANGQGSGNAPNGATIANTATVIAGRPPTSAPRTSGNAGSNASFRLDSGFRELWTLAIAFVAVLAGALVVL